MLGPVDLLLGGVIPGIVALLIRATLHRIGWTQAAWPLAIASGVVVGQASLAAVPTVAEAGGLTAAVSAYFAALPEAFAAFVQPRQASHWLAAGTVVAAAATLLLARRHRVARRAGALLGLALAFTLPTRLLWGSVYFLSEWSREEAILRVALMACGLVALGWLALPRVEPDDSPTSLGPPTTPRSLIGPVLMAVVALGVSVLLATSGSLSYAQHGGVMLAAIVGATLGAMGQISYRSLGEHAGHGGLVVVTWLSGLAMLGAFYAEITPLNVVLAVVGLGAAIAAGGTRHTTWRRVAVCSVVCVAAVGFAITSSGLEFSRAIAQPTDNPYLNWQPPSDTGVE
ncbi:MAG: hypothetical protein AAFV43_01975 [Planctomycetota bacterium]